MNELQKFCNNWPAALQGFEIVPTSLELIPHGEFCPVVDYQSGFNDLKISDALEIGKIIHTIVKSWFSGRRIAIYPSGKSSEVFL